MKRILIEVEYDGKKFCGWQNQPKLRTVQGELQKVISEFLGEEIKLFASGRTDAGVSAKSQFSHFDTNSNFNFEKLPLVINSRLSHDLAIKSAKEVDEIFHARFKVVEKEYHYKVYISRHRSPLRDEIAYRVKQDVNIDEMKCAANYLIGKHDFTSFCTKRDDEQFQGDYGEKLGNIREIFKLQIERDDEFITFKISANGFLYNMVRIIVGTLLEVGEGKRKSDEILEILNKKDRTFAGKTLPSKGLILFSVKY